MYKIFLLLFALLCISGSSLSADNGDENNSGDKPIRQWYSGKLGYYHPGGGLNNGLLLGVDGITEFTKHHFFLSGALDAYVKQDIDLFGEPKPQIYSQQIIVLPLHVNIGYNVFSIDEPDCRGYLGVGGGYYLYFYSLEYQTDEGILPRNSSWTDSKAGGNFFGTAFARVTLGKLFVEPRLYFSSIANGHVASYNFSVDPSGFALSIGFQQ